MNDIKIWIGNLNYPNSKLPWLPTINSVLSTQRFLKNKYNYMTVIIFRKLTDDDYTYTISNDVLYTSSATDILTQHIGATNTITIPGFYDYYDGNYYYSYLVMYSNTFNIWNVVNNSNVYAVLYDQTIVNISYPYIMNEWRITKNVAELIVSAGVNNVTTLIIPNQMEYTINFENFYNVNYCEKFQLFNILNPLINQEIETFNGLLYTINQDILIAVPHNYKPDVYNNINLSSNCNSIRTNTFSNGTIDMRYDTSFNTLFGENVTDIDEYSLAFVSAKIFNFPKLQKFNNFALYLNDNIETLYLPKSLMTMYEDSLVPDTDKFTNILFENDFGINLDTNVYLQHCNVLDVSLLATQFYNLATIKTDNIIYLHNDIYDALTPEEIDIAINKGWKVEVL